ncbi:hypothetical protein GCM10009528_08170 [Kineococcus aurantiacus]
MAHVAACLGTSTNRARRLAHTALPAGFARAVTVPRVVLVEGATDAAVLGALLAVPVVAVGGKHVFPLAVAVARAHGADVDVVLDSDAGDHRAHHGSRRVQAALAAAPVRLHVLPGDLEVSLAGWASFLHALHRDGGALDKDPARYAAAARAASRADLPPTLSCLITEVLDHGSA